MSHAEEQAPECFTNAMIARPQNYRAEHCGGWDIYMPLLRYTYNALIDTFMNWTPFSLVSVRLLGPSTINDLMGLAPDARATTSPHAFAAKLLFWVTRFRKGMDKRMKSSAQQCNEQWNQKDLNEPLWCTSRQFVHFDWLPPTTFARNFASLFVQENDVSKLDSFKVVEVYPRMLTVYEVAIRCSVLIKWAAVVPSAINAQQQEEYRQKGGDKLFNNVKKGVRQKMANNRAADPQGHAVNHTVRHVGEGNTVKYVVSKYGCQLADVSI